jgi:phage tail tape-measure protein
MNEADFRELAGESLFTILDDLLKSQRDMIKNQNELIEMLMNRIKALESAREGIKGVL